MRKFALLICGVFALMAQAAPNPVIAHYRAYTAALEASDLETAEREADAALQASIARDQNGGRTAVLAANLAKVRLQRGNPEDAHAPAQLAFDIAATNPGAGVAPTLANLILGRTELPSPQREAGGARIFQALEEAAARPELGADAYAAAADLGALLTEREEYEDAARAWSYAARYAPSSGQTLAQAEALIAEAASRIMRSMPVGIGDEERRQRFRASEYQLARASLRLALRTLGPLVQERNGVELTAAQRDYGAALAWGRYVGANVTIPGADMDLSLGAPADPSTCRMRIIAEPRPQFPRNLIENYVEGVVIMRVLFDQSGQPEDIRIAAALPDYIFPQAVSRVSSQWRAERVLGTPVDCRVPPVLFVPVVFSIRD